VVKVEDERSITISENLALDSRTYCLFSNRKKKKKMME
jgi:hypothetical protein